MYTLDGLWYNVIFYDAFAFLCGCICLVSGFLNRNKKKDAKWLMILGAVAVIVCTSLLVKDCNGISKQNFSVSTGTIEYSHRVKRQVPFSYGYTFKQTNTRNFKHTTLMRSQ